MNTANPEKFERERCPGSVKAEAERVKAWIPKMVTACQDLSEAVVHAPDDETYRKLKRHRDTLEQLAIGLDKLATKELARYGV